MSFIFDWYGDFWVIFSALAVLEQAKNDVVASISDVSVIYFTFFKDSVYKTNLRIKSFFKDFRYYFRMVFFGTVYLQKLFRFVVKCV